MANSAIQIKRTSVSGRAANSTTLTRPGELALNMTDGILYSTNGTNIFEIGSNNTNTRVTGNATVRAIIANGSLGTAGQMLTTNGTVIYWSTPAAGGGGSVNVDAQYTWTNLHTFSNSVTFSGQIANSTGFYSTSNTVGAELGNTTRRFNLTGNNATFNGNVGIGTTVQTDTRFQITSAPSNDFSTWNIYSYLGDGNTSMTAARTKYGIQSQLYNFNQNKNVDGVTTYATSYRAITAEAYNGSTSTGGDAYADELVGGRFNASQYANGANANAVNNMYGVKTLAFLSGSGVVSSVYGVMSQVYVANSTVTGNAGFAVGVYSSVTSNVASTINGGYLFYGDHLGNNTTTKYGIYLNGESNNSFSGSLYVGANLFVTAQTVFGFTQHANSLGHYPQSNTVGKDFGTSTRRWNIFATTGDFSGNVGIGVSSPQYQLQVNGSFAATTKSFVIDHPTKPNMKLRHGSLEGPENGVYVRGRLYGQTWIYLPEYWSNLVDENSITVNLTATHMSQPDVCVMSVNNSIVVLNQAYMGFYTVYAERKDVPSLVVEF